MVLEGLRQAEEFLALLRSLGFTQTAGRTFGAEHIDHDFVSKQYGPALCVLRQALQTRCLKMEEIARLEHLAKLGLLDGLLEGIDQPVNDDPSCSLMPQLQRLQSLCKQLEMVVSKQLAEEDQARRDLDSALLNESDSEKILLSQPTTTEMPSLFLGKPETILVPLQALLGGLSARRQRIGQALEGLSQSIQHPLQLVDHDEPILRYGTVNVGKLMSRAWSEEDQQMYLAMIERGCQMLASFGIKLDQDILLGGEILLEGIRREFGHLLSTQMEGLALKNRILAQLVEYKLVGLEGELGVLCKLLYELHYTLSTILQPLRSPLSTGVPPSGIQFEWPPEQAEDDQWAEGMLQRISQGIEMAQTRMEALQGLLDRLVSSEHPPKIAIISPLLYQMEEELRQQSLQASEELQQLSTDGARIRLLARRTETSR